MSSTITPIRKYHLAIKTNLHPFKNAAKPTNQNQPAACVINASHRESRCGTDVQRGVCRRRRLAGRRDAWRRPRDELQIAAYRRLSKQPGCTPCKGKPPDSGGGGREQKIQRLLENRIFVVPIQGVPKLKAIFYLCVLGLKLA